ncbi:MAG: hypothetical protein CMB99_00030 [Flavobacteriaceae bacterium]|jgi:cell wall-associated NlpC family hydrolase|nr:hypothetical protein [Flavobacteriaceae bacterium]|tara:strand:+ start:29749 stop:30210 length:462 start_codon:yes stop_codon:yes gene_type:complete
MSNFEVAKFEGKFFNLGKQDCFSVVEGFYLENFGIEIPPFSRPSDWDPETDNLIEKYWPLSGFEMLDVDEHWPPRPADIMVCTVGGSVPNHLVIFLGGNEILHHKVNMMSSRETMRPAWRRYTSYLLRHPDVPDLREKKPTLELKEVYDEGLV